MKLLDDMRRADLSELSPFTQQLVKEDIVRLEKLVTLSDGEFEGYKSSAMKLGWTQGDARTHELNPELSGFLEAAFKNESDASILMAWNALHKRRMDLLVGCLSRPRID